MNITRKAFVKNGLMALTGVALRPQMFVPNRYNNIILGIQLYSVRDDMRKDNRGTLKKLAGIGYKYVEHAGYEGGKFYGYGPKEFKSILNDLNLKMISGHVQFGLNDWDTRNKDFTDNWKRTVEDAVSVGQTYLVNAWIDESYRNDYGLFMKLLDLFNKCGEMSKAMGVKFGYHNHDFEFNSTLKGKNIFDLIMNHTAPSLVALQLEIGNMVTGGGDAMNILHKYSGRFELMHVKDEIESEHGEMGEKYESTILGKGILPIKKIIDTGKEIGTSCFIIEQESYQGKASLDCVREDYIVMKNWGY